MVRVLILAKNNVDVLLSFTIATANGNRRGTVDGKSINLSKIEYNDVLLLFTIATANGNRQGTVDGKSIDLSKNRA